MMSNGRYFAGIYRHINYAFLLVCTLNKLHKMNHFNQNHFKNMMNLLDRTKVALDKNYCVCTMEIVQLSCY